MGPYRFISSHAHLCLSLVLVDHLLQSVNFTRVVLEGLQRERRGEERRSEGRGGGRGERKRRGEDTLMLWVMGSCGSYMYLYVLHILTPMRVGSSLGSSTPDSSLAFLSSC